MFCFWMFVILQAACFVVTALLHLFFMASFAWMLVEGLLLWSKVVSVNISEDRRMKLYYIIGWGKVSSPFSHLSSWSWRFMSWLPRFGSNLSNLL